MLCLIYSPDSFPRSRDPWRVMERIQVLSLAARTHKLALVVKNPPANTGNTRDAGLIPGLGRSPGGGNGSTLQYSCLRNPMDRGAGGLLVHGVAKRWTD